MNNIDLLIIVIFLAGSAGFGIWQGRKNVSSTDYFVAGRSLPWIAAMFSIVATETSVLTFISIPGLAYRGDWQFLQLALGYIAGRILVSIFLLPIYFKTGVTSIYEVLGDRFGLKIQKLASGIFMITRVLADGIRFLAVAVIVQLITGWSLSTSILIIGLITLIYTYSGGIRSIVWIDSFQFFLYLSGGIISIIYILVSSDVSITNIINELSIQNKFQILNLNWHIFTNPFAFISAFIGGTLLSFASHGADYMMVQRVLSTKDLSSARKAMVGSGLFVFIQFCVFLFAGSLIFYYFGGIELKNDREFPTFIAQYLPTGLKGLLLAGVLSSAMSTLSSSINSLASSTINDWVKKTKSLKLSRLVSIFWAAVLIGIALVFDEGNEAIVIMGLQIASFTYGGLLSLFILSKMKRKFSPVNIAIGLIFSILTVLVLKYFGLAWTWYIVFAVIVNISITYILDSIIKYNFK
ncbi:MAG: sodium:solute symporter [Planctomycetia bacterium]|nr:sodium:solute symporter [Planctomycetia bacterium]